MKIVHLSDLHVGRSDNAEATEIIAKGLTQRYAADKPLVIITGDIVDDGQRWQFELARESLSPLFDSGFTVLSCPGNHDMGWNGVNAKESNLSLFLRHFAHKDSKYYDDFPTVHRANDLVCIGLNSMADEVGFLDRLSADGELGKRQIKQLDYELRKLDVERKSNPNLRVVVYLHHHPFYYNSFMALKDHEDLKDVLRARKATTPTHSVALLLFGHKHENRELPDKGDKYGIGGVFAAHKSTDMKKGDKGLPVYKVVEIDVETRKGVIVELLA
jgi:3',5'-cyclic AMP phosphodiesterase CpdA